MKPSSIHQAFVAFCLALLLHAPGSIAASNVDSESVEGLSVATKTVPGQRMFASRHNVPMVELAGNLEGLATRLASTQIRAGGEVDGPLHILVESFVNESGRDQEVWLAFPTRGNPRSSGRNRSISTKPFLCTYLNYEGAAEGISSAMARFAKATERAGYELSGQARLVFACDGNCGKEYTVVELQLGIE